MRVEAHLEAVSGLREQLPGEGKEQRPVPVLADRLVHAPALADGLSVHEHAGVGGETGQVYGQTLRLAPGAGQLEAIPTGPIGLGTGLSPQIQERDRLPGPAFSPGRGRLRREQEDPLLQRQDLARVRKLLSPSRPRHGREHEEGEPKRPGPPTRCDHAGILHGRIPGEISGRSSGLEADAAYFSSSSRMEYMSWRASTM
jgi:hypothetical protein